MERQHTNLENKIRATIEIWKRGRVAAHEGGHRPDPGYTGNPRYDMPEEIEEGLVEGYYPEGRDSELTLWPPEIIDRTIYNSSVFTEEDPRLKDD